MLIDSHCHLNYFTPEELPQILINARNSNVTILQTICTKLDEVEYLKKITETEKNIFCSVGVHPNEVNNFCNLTAQQIMNHAHHPKVISIGETGLDYHYKVASPITQKSIFLQHIEAARQLKLPVVIHCREADKDMIEILQTQSKKGNFTAVLHSFSSSEELCNVALELGIYISFSGIVTFKNASQLQMIAKRVPSNRILIETDAPYLSPVPKRGKRNEPAFIKHTLDFLVDLRQEKNLEQVTQENFFHLFSKAMVPN